MTPTDQRFSSHLLNGSFGTGNPEPRTAAVGPIGLGMAHAAPRKFSRAVKTYVGKPEAAMTIEHEVIRAVQPMLVTRVIEAFDGAGRKVDPFDATGERPFGKSKPRRARRADELQPDDLSDSGSATG